MYYYFKSFDILGKQAGACSCCFHNLFLVIYLRNNSVLAMTVLSSFMYNSEQELVFSVEEAYLKGFKFRKHYQIS